MGSDCLMGTRFIWGNEDILEAVEVMVAQDCESTKCH